jgi:hypothetical protein
MASPTSSDPKSVAKITGEKKILTTHYREVLREFDKNSGLSMRRKKLLISMNKSLKVQKEQGFSLSDLCLSIDVLKSEKMTIIKLFTSQKIGMKEFSERLTLAEKQQVILSKKYATLEKEMHSEQQEYAVLKNTMDALTEKSSELDHECDLIKEKKITPQQVQVDNLSSI